jgi:hypothetical protein
MRHKASHKAEVNWAPLLEVMISGTPYLVTHSLIRTAAQSAAAVDAMGTTSTHLVVLSIIVNK